MSISAITSSSTTSTSSVNSEMKQRRDTFSALEKAISSGDLDSAKTAFATMKSDMEKMQAIRQQITGNTNSSNSSSNSSSSSSDDPMSKAMEALSTALESGDTSSVQDAFSSLKETMKAGRKRHAGHAEGDMPPPPPPSSSSTSSTSTTSNNNSDTLGSNIDVMA